MGPGRAGHDSMIARRCMVALWGRYGALFQSWTENQRKSDGGQWTRASLKRDLEKELPTPINYNYNVFFVCFQCFPLVFWTAWQVTAGWGLALCVLVWIQQLEPVRSTRRSGIIFTLAWTVRWLIGWCWLFLQLYATLWHCGGMFEIEF